MFKSGYISLALVIVLMLLSSFSSFDNSHKNVVTATISAIEGVAATAYFSSYTENEDLHDFTEEIIEKTGLEAEGVDILITAPSVLPVETTLVCDVEIIDIEPGLESLLFWYINDELVMEKQVFTGDDLPGITKDFEYDRIMVQTVHVRVLLRHLTEDGSIQEITDEITIDIENYSMTHWIELEAPRVMELVSSTYKGDYTLEWALENDYDDFDKEVFVNTMGYESETEYLLWVNRSHQRVNVFIGAAGRWELIETFLVGTGGRSSATRRGVTYIPSRTTEGWNFGSHKVEPVVRFFPGSRYAFHSRLLHPRTGEVIDERIGFPVSAGCIRMYNEDVWYIYHNIPDRTTVVIH